MKLDIRKQVIQNYLKLAKEKCPFTDEDLINGYIEGFLDCAEIFESKYFYNLNYYKNEKHNHFEGRNNYELSDYEKYQIQGQQIIDDMNTWR